MTCACIPNADETAIVRACQLHTEWARKAAEGRLLMSQSVPMPGTPAAYAAMKANARPGPR